MPGREVLGTQRNQLGAGGGHAAPSQAVTVTLARVEVAVLSAAVRRGASAHPSDVSRVLHAKRLLGQSLTGPQATREHVGWSLSRVAGSMGTDGRGGLSDTEEVPAACPAAARRCQRRLSGFKWGSERSLRVPEATQPREAGQEFKPRAPLWAVSSSPDRQEPSVWSLCNGLLTPIREFPPSFLPAPIFWGQ